MVYDIDKKNKGVNWIREQSVKTFSTLTRQYDYVELEDNHS